MRAGESTAGNKQKRETERNRLAEREMEFWRVLAMEWVVKLTVGIEHLIISITQTNGLNTTLIR
jgi:hypothetical protein